MSASTLNPASRISAIGRSGRSATGESVVLVVAVAFAALLRFRGLGHQALWLDEAWTRDIAASPAHLLMDRIAAWESTPPLYYLLVRVVWWSGGNTAGWLRSLSAFAGTVTVPVVWMAGRDLISRGAGLSAAVICACSPLLWWYSQEARAYSLATLFVAVALAFFARAMIAPTARGMAGMSLASTAAIGTEYLACLPLGIALLLLVRRHPQFRANVVAAFLPVGAVGAALIPLAVHQRSLGLSSWIEKVPLADRVAQVPIQAFAGRSVGGSLLPLALGLGASVLAVAVLWCLAGRATPGQRRGIGAAASIAAGSGLILLGLALVGLDLLVARNLLMAWPAAAIAAGGCIAAAGPRRCALVTGVLAAGMIALIIRVDRSPELQRVDWRPVSAMLGPAPRGGRLIALQRVRSTRPLSMYLPAVAALDGDSASVGEVVVVAASLPGQRVCWWPGSCAPNRRSQTDVESLLRLRLPGLGRRSIRSSGAFTAVAFRGHVRIAIARRSLRREMPRGSLGAVLRQAEPTGSSARSARQPR